MLIAKMCNNEKSEDNREPFINVLRSKLKPIQTLIKDKKGDIDREGLKMDPFSVIYLLKTFANRLLD